ncbi:MAG: ferrous iron transporter B [Armatimonadota bacterium]|nr:ferrous iron transporter B [Armatimonadota bacterium]
MATSAPAEGLITYSEEVETAVSSIVAYLRAGDYGLTTRSVALLCLQGDEEILERVGLQEGEEAEARIRDILGQVTFCPTVPLAYQLMLSRTERARELATSSVSSGPGRKRSEISQKMGALCSHPVFGFPILLLVLYFGLYQFVGVFGAGTLVGWIEEDLFGTIINPFVIGLVEQFAGAGSVAHELLVGEYGVWTLGVTYAVALILPIIFSFFLIFSVLEDSGYLPRLALLVDRMFKKIGLNGRGVIPIVLGFGCDTMATVVTRILETKRERVIATFLLSLAIPCTAQLAVVTGLLAGASIINGPLGLSFSPLLAAWALIMLGIFLLGGYFAAKLTPGKTAPFYLELPPMRMPSVSNVLVKTFARMQWYFLEVAPLFLIASVVIWLGRMPAGWVVLLGWIGFAIGKRGDYMKKAIFATAGALAGWAMMAITQGRTAFDVAISALEPLAKMLTLPLAAAEVFLFGFFRRDYGAAGLDKMIGDHSLSQAQVLVIAVTITLFLPCIAQFLVVKKERGIGMAIGMLAFTLFFATFVGAGLAGLLRTTGWLS